MLQTHRRQITLEQDNNTYRAKPLRKPKALLIDDDRTIRRLMMFFLDNCIA